VELVLVRHAEPSGDFRGRCYGRLDVELSELGREQSARVAAALADAPVSAVVSSPLQRARETAEAIAEPHGLRVVVLDGLRELDFGEFEGKSYDELAASRPQLYRQWMTAPTEVRFPGGESYADLEARVADVVRRLRAVHGGRTVVAVTHGGVVRAVVAAALGLPDDRIFRLSVDTASITRVGWHQGVAIVRSVNASKLGPRQAPD
jgi:alpha-ribazole phosphatase/probable phosphoglycerate mutase